MNGALILLLVLLTPYLVLNVVRLVRGRRWAFTVCQVAKEWEEGRHAKLLAERAAARADQPAAPSAASSQAISSRPSPSSATGIEGSPSSARASASAFSAPVTSSSV